MEAAEFAVVVAAVVDVELGCFDAELSHVELHCSLMTSHWPDHVSEGWTG